MINYITEFKQAVAALKEIESCSVIQVDSETTGLHFLDNELLLVQVGTKKNQHIFDVRKLGKGPLGDLLRPTFENRSVVKIIQNALFDVVFFRQHLQCHVHNIFDTKLAETVLTCGMANDDGTRLSTSLLDTLNRYGLASLEKETVKEFIASDNPVITKDMIKYAAKDVMHLEKLMNKQLDSATEKDLRIINLENSVVEITADMRFQGICFDEKEWRRIAVENEKLFKKQLAKMPNDVDNWNSNTQVKKYFANEHDIVIDSYQDLDQMRLTEKNKIFQEFCKLRDLYQNVKLYGENWLTVELNNRAPIQVSNTVHNGRVHGGFNQIVETGRYSSVQPNLQQLPALGLHRTCFHADKGTMFVISDYTGQEIATAAVASGEYRWIYAIQDGLSIHDLMSKQIYGPKYTEKQRLLIKKVNFAILYGSGKSTIARNLLISYKEAEELIRKWKAAVPILRNWLYQEVKKAESTKMSYSLYGRKRHLNQFKNTYTVGQNNPIQSTGADMLKLAMVMIQAFFRKVGWGRIVLCIHDEIITEVPTHAAKAFAPKMKAIMEDAANQVLGMTLISTEPYIATRWEKPKKTK